MPEITCISTGEVMKKIPTNSSLETDLNVQKPTSAVTVGVTVGT
jgi:hypothetical protein